MQMTLVAKWDSSVAVERAVIRFLADDHLMRIICPPARKTAIPRANLAAGPGVNLTRCVCEVVHSLIQMEYDKWGIRLRYEEFEGAR